MRASSFYQQTDNANERPTERNHSMERTGTESETKTIENCMHIFCETPNDIHSSSTIDKYRVFASIFFSSLRFQEDIGGVGGIDAGSRSKEFKYFF